MQSHVPTQNDILNSQAMVLTYDDISSFQQTTHKYNRNYSLTLKIFQYRQKKRTKVITFFFLEHSKKNTVQ